MGRAVLVAALAVLSGCGGEICDAGALSAALDSAAPGGHVQVGACAIEGSFDVPAGVVLEGSGPASILRSGDAARAVLVVTAGTPATSLRALRLEGPFLVGVYASGPGALRIESTSIESATGVAIATSGVAEVTLIDVDVRGPIPAGTEVLTDAGLQRVAPYVPSPLVPALPGTCADPPACTTGETRAMDCTGCGASVTQYCDPCGLWTSVIATIGVAIEEASAASFERVSVRGMAEYGVVVRGASTRLTWTGGDADQNLGVGVYAEASDATLEGVSVSGTRQALRAALPYAVFARAPAGGMLRTTALQLADNAGFGLVQRGLGGEHVDLSAQSQGNAALWIGESPGFVLRDSMLESSAFAGVVLVSTTDVAISGTTVTGTRLLRQRLPSPGGVGAIEMGDGIQLFDTETRVSLSDVVLEGNERMGLSVDLGARTADADVCGAGTGLCFDAVTVRATGAQLGAVAGGMRMELGSEPGVFTVQPLGSGTWDRGILREGAASTNDPLHVDPVPLTGVIAPSDLDPTGVIAPSD